MYKSQVHTPLTQIGKNQISKHNILLAGFLCQPFSIAGVSKKNSLGRKHGFADETQRTLFYDIVRILEAKLPKAFLLENVKNLKSHDKGGTFKIISGVLREIDYITFYQIIDAKHYVPQHRKRIIIAGFNREYYNDTSYSNSLNHRKKKHGFVIYLLKIRIQDIRLLATFEIICRTTQRSIKKKETDLVLGL